MENQLTMPGEMKVQDAPKVPRVPQIPRGEVASGKPAAAETQKPKTETQTASGRTQGDSSAVHSETAQSAKDAQELQRANQTLEEIKKETQLLQKATKAQEAFEVFARFALILPRFLKNNPDMVATVGTIGIALLNDHFQLAPSELAGIIDLLPTLAGGMVIGEKVKPVSRFVAKGSEGERSHAGKKGKALLAADMAVGVAATTGLSEGSHHLFHNRIVGKAIGVLDDIPGVVVKLAGVLAKVGVKV